MTAAPQDMIGRVALVTGAGGGIGRATARAFAARGAQVAALDIDAAAAATTVDEVKAAGGTAEVFPVDVSDAAAVDAAVRAVVDRFGRLDYAHNNAGVEGEVTRLADVTQADWDRVIRINLTGVWLCLRAEIKAMAGRGGAIVNTASASGLVARPGGLSTYVASKHGVVGLTKAAAVDYAVDGIRVNAVLPGPIATPFTADLPQEIKDQLTSLTPIRRFAQAEEVAEAVVWLCSDAASYMVGARSRGRRRRRRLLKTRSPRTTEVRHDRDPTAADLPPHPVRPVRPDGAVLRDGGMELRRGRGGLGVHRVAGRDRRREDDRPGAQREVRGLDDPQPVPGPIRRARGTARRDLSPRTRGEETMQSLRDKVAVVTGAASGVGLGLAERFAAEGMKVVLADVEEAPLKSAVERLRAGGAEAVGVRTDVRHESEVQALADATLDAFGEVHLLCNNAGVETGGSFAEIPTESWKWVLDVNLWGVLHGCRIFLPLLRRHPEAHIVNTGSGASFSAALPTFAPYITSKFAVLGLSESLDMELRAAGDPVRVSFLAPIARTRMSESERNRPAGVPSTERDTQRTRILDTIRAVSDQIGLDPAEVAGLVVDAVHEERFFVVVQPEDSVRALRDRIAWLEGGPAAEQLRL